MLFLLRKFFVLVEALMNLLRLKYHEMNLFMTNVMGESPRESPKP